jgi:calcineurin-like phosphoesterase family protein
MSYIFVTSDMHWGHTGIIKYCKRPFKDVVDMNTTLAINWNQRINETDLVFHLGDWCFTGRSGLSNKAIYYEYLVNGKIIHIQGNHDANNSLKGALDVAIITIGNKQVMMQHRPPTNINEVPDFVNFVLCGHVHEKWKHMWLKKDDNLENDLMVINVGIDVWNFKPVRIDEILGYYNSNLNKKVERTYL